MNTNTNIKYYTAFVPVYDEAGEGDEAEDDPKGTEDDPKGGTEDDPKGAAKGTKFTPEQQEHMNKLLATERRKGQDATKKVAEELKVIQQRSDLTKQEREDLDARVTTLQDELLTKEELAKQEAKKSTNKHEKEVETLTNERDTWMKRFREGTIKTDIVNACSNKDHQAINVDQVIAIIEPQTQLIEEVDDDGKETGNFVTRTKFKTVDDKGKSVTLTLNVGEVVKKMAGDDKWFNLFEHTGTGGLGGRQGKTGKGDISDADLAKSDPGALIDKRLKTD